MKIKNIISCILRLVVAIILLQTLYYKFTAHPDSVYIFSKLEIEPWGRISLGVIELITAFLIIVPKTKTIGLLISFFIIIGAVFAHLKVLGINVSNDGGGLFTLASIILISDIIYFIINKNDFKSVLKNTK